MCTVSLMPRAPGRDEVPQHPLDRLGPLREDYKLRMGTFELWSNPSINTKDLCDNGFYYMGIGDKVQCAFCGGVLSGWNCGDNIHIKHATNYGHCIVVRMVKHTRYAVYNERLLTYNNWPESFTQNPIDLATAGLFYKGEHDICVCYMCGGHITEWEDNDIPEIEHRKLFPTCPLSQRMGYDEIPQHPLERLRPMRENYELRMNTFQEWSNPNVSPKELCDDGSPDMVQCAFCGGVLSGWRPGDNVHKQHAVNFGQCRKVCKYANYEERLASFRNWPQNLPQSPIDLASAGLFYTGKRDICKCFMCDGCVCDWEADDVPSKEHTRIFPDCPLSQKTA